MRIFFLTLLIIVMSEQCYAMSLTDALVHAYHHNPDLVAKREELKAVDEEKFKAISEFLPKIYFVRSMKQNRRDSFPTEYSSVTGKRGIASPWLKSEELQNKLVLEQSLFNGGSSLAALESAKYKIEQTRAELRLVEQSALLNVVKAYLEVMFRWQILEVNKSNVAAFERYLIATKAKFEAGINTKTDIALAEATLAKAKYGLIAAEGNYYSALANFRMEVGIDAENLESTFVAAELPSNLQETINGALKYHPGVLRIKAQLNSAQTGIKSVVASMWPNLSLNAEMGAAGQKFPARSDVPTIDPGKTHYKAISLQLVVPIYQQGMEYSRMRAAKALLAKAKADYKKTNEELRKAATQGWTIYQARLSGHNAAIRAEKAYKVALDGATQEYQEGIKSITELLDARAKYYESQMSLLQTEKESKESSYELKAIMGKLTAKDLSLPTAIYDPAKNYNDINFKLIGF